MANIQKVERGRWAMVAYNTDRVKLKKRMLAAKDSDAFTELCRFRSLVEAALDGDPVLLAAHRRADAGAFYLLSRGPNKSSGDLARSVAEQVFSGLLLDEHEDAADRYIDISNAAINGEILRHFVRPGFVYFIHDSRHAAIKIGYTVNIRDRLSQLQTAEPYKRQLLLSIAGTTSDESRLHERFAHIRLDGEWFKDCTELRDYIAGVQPTTTLSLPKTVEIGFDDDFEHFLHDPKRKE